MWLTLPAGAFQGRGPGSPGLRQKAPEASNTPPPPPEDAQYRSCHFSTGQTFLMMVILRGQISGHVTETARGGSFATSFFP